MARANAALDLGTMIFPTLQMILHHLTQQLMMIQTATTTVVILTIIAMIILISCLCVTENKNKMENPTSPDYITAMELRALDSIESKLNVLSTIARKACDSYREKSYEEMVNKARIVCFFSSLIDQDLKILEQIKKK